MWALTRGHSSLLITTLDTWRFSTCHPYQHSLKNIFLLKIESTRNTRSSVITDHCLAGSSNIRWTLNPPSSHPTGQLTCWTSCTEDPSCTEMQKFAPLLTDYTRESHILIHTSSLGWKLHNLLRQTLYHHLQTFPTKGGHTPNHLDIRKSAQKIFLDREIVNI